MDNLNFDAHPLIKPLIKDFFQFVEEAPYKDVLAGETVLKMSPKKGNLSFGLVKEGLLVIKNRLTTQQPFRSTWLVGEYQWFGLESLTHNMTVLNYEAVIDSRVWLFGVEELLQFKQANLISLIAEYSAMHYNHLFRFLNYRESLETRVLSMLYLIRTKTKRLEVELTMNSLADLCSTARTKISPILNKFASEGLLEKSYKNYILADHNTIIDYWSKHISAKN